MPENTIKKTQSRDNLKDLQGSERIGDEPQISRRDQDGSPEDSAVTTDATLDPRRSGDLMSEEKICPQDTELIVSEIEPLPQQNEVGDPVTVATSSTASNDKIISDEPKGTADMSVASRSSKENEPSDSSNRSSMVTLSSDGSGYERETHECTEFCIDFLRCFGMFDECCPSSGEGYFTTAALFCANILVGIRKC